MNFGSKVIRFPQALVYLCVGLVFLIFCRVLPAAGPDPDLTAISRPSIKVFTAANGLPVNTVMTLERDQRGYLWVGTQDGAARYNGKDFTVIDMPNRVRSNYIYDILATGDGSIWFATGNGGIHRLRDNQWISIDKNNGLQSDQARVLLETTEADDNKILWVGRRDGLSIRRAGKWENYGTDDGLPDPRVRSLLETEDAVWIGTYGGIAVWSDGKITKTYNQTDGLPGKIIYSLMKTRKPNGKYIYWAGTEKGLVKFENGQWHTFEQESDLLTRPVRSMESTVKADGTLTVWIGFDGDGLAYLENGQWNYLTQKDGLPNNLIFALAGTGAPDGSVWMSNLAAGISRFERSNWRTIDDTNGLPNKLVFSFAESVDQSGKPEFWFGTYGKGLVRNSTGSWEYYDTGNGLTDDYVQSLYMSEDDSGTPVLYIGSEKGLNIYKKGQFKEVKLLADQPSVEIWDIGESVDQNGVKSLLLATNLGLIRKTEEQIELTDDTNGLPGKSLRDVHETVSSSGEKTLWAATYNAGLARLQNGKWTVFDLNNGLPTNRIYSITEIFDRSKRELWIGTGGGGIAVVDLDLPEPVFDIISTETSKLLPSNTVYQIFRDSKNRIYATTNKGISRITRTKDGYRSYVFTTADGLPSNECISGAGFIDTKNRIWVGTVGGVAILDAPNELDDTKPDLLFLEKVLIGDEEKKFVAGTELAYSENDLTFEYAMPSNYREAGTVYRTQMVGLEDKPTEWTSESRREFTFLPSGKFIFRVWGRDASGNISGPLELPFRIRPAWWQTWWAISLYFLATALVVGLIAYLIYRNRLARMLAIERVRTRIARDLHDDIGASLSQISILSDVLQQDRKSVNGEIEQILQTISATSRDVIGSMSEMVWAINPNRDNVLDTTQRMRRFAIDSLSGTEIELDFRSSGFDEAVKIDVDQRRQIYLIFKEAVNNALKYANCSKLKIRVLKKGGVLRLLIADNGIGFETGQITGDGNGLVNMRRRAEKIGGRIEIKSVIGGGTTVELRVPLLYWMKFYQS